MLIHRSNVVLPDPLGPITTTAWPRGTESDTPRSTSLVPNRFATPRISSMRRGSVSAKDPSLQIFAVPRQCEAHAEVQERGTEEDLERRQGPLNDFPACQSQFPQADHRHER